MSDVDGELMPAGPAPSADRRLRVAMVTSVAEHCGIAAYSRRLVSELERHVEIAWLTDAEHFSPVMNEADIVHVQHQYFLFGGVAPWKSTFRRFAKRVTAPMVMTVHEFVAPAGSPARRLAIASANRMNFGHVGIREFIVHTDQDHNRLASAGVARNRVHVIRHGVPDPPPMPARVQARKELGLEQSFVLTIYGFLARRKGYGLAIEALSMLPPNVRLILAGGRHPDDRTTYADEIERTVTRAGLADRVTITGYLSDEQSATVMAATDLVLAPFEESSGSGSLAYAFSCGKPVVASAIAPNVEINRVVPGALSLFPAGNAAALADAVAHLMRNARALTRLSEGARRYATTFTYGTMAEATVAVYHEAIRNADSCA
ncbi:MAG: glycosyltransferase [Chthonomonadales bacterium]|nr:glycosyltransferase [Chthonomonadales bacterium]